MKIKCPNCELNYIDEDEELCSVCKEQLKIGGTSTRDKNKNMVEEFLLPQLREFRPDVIEQLTQKGPSFELLHLRLPLLIKCKDMGEEECKKEITVDNSSTYRYYKKPYMINGKLYHICSQWWSADTNNSKDILKLFEEINKRQTKKDN